MIKPESLLICQEIFRRALKKSLKLFDYTPAYRRQGF
jgi:hypothetical protein